MNEQIRLLALQANPASKEIYESDNWEYNCAAWSAQDLEKFAELIVRECAELYNHDDVLAPVGQSAWGEAYQDGWIEGTRIYKETILEHFGVEE